jgi:HSP20 family molecular chaperone IbpA
MFDYFYWFDKAFNEESCSKRYSYKHILQEDKELLAVNCAGFSKEDVKIEAKSIGDRDFIYITGTPKDDVKEFVEPMNIRFEVKSSIIDQIEADVKDGMLYITVTRRENKPKFNIKF